MANDLFFTRSSHKQPNADGQGERTRRPLVPGSCEAAPYTRRALAPEGIRSRHPNTALSHVGSWPVAATSRAKLKRRARDQDVPGHKGCRRSIAKGRLGCPVLYHEIKDSLVGYFIQFNDLHNFGDSEAVLI